MQKPVKSNLPNYMQTVFDQVRKSMEADQLNVERDISSTRTGLAQEIWGMSVHITKRLDRVHPDVSGSG